MPVVTVFSSSGYRASGRNQAGCLLIDESGAASPLFFQQQEVVDRATAEFFMMDCHRAEPSGLPRVTSLPLSASDTGPMGIRRSTSRLINATLTGVVGAPSARGVRRQLSRMSLITSTADRPLITKRPREISFAEDESWG
jgi:hypothetical protein